jgi:type IV pilus assembly protein PilC
MTSTSIPADKSSQPDPKSSNVRSMERVFGGISLKALEAFCRRMSIGLKSGVDLLRILGLETKTGTARHREVATNMIDALRSGHTLSESMGLQGYYFPSLLVKMIDAGEHAGGMDRTFREMADYYQDLKQTRSAFISQITFPVIQLFLAFGIACLAIYINGFFGAGSSQDKPFDLTGIGLRGAPGVLIFTSISTVLFGIVAVIAFSVWKNWFGCHKTLVPLVRHVPVIGTVLTMTALSRLSMTLSMMLGSGVDAKRSVRDALLSTGNYYYISGLEKTTAAIVKGKSFAEALDAPKLLPEEFIQSVEVGEMSGSDSESLERMAVVYREKAQLALKQFAIMAGLAVWLFIAAMIITAIFMIVVQIAEVYSNALSGK